MGALLWSGSIERAYWSELIFKRPDNQFSARALRHKVVHEFGLERIKEVIKYGDDWFPEWTNWSAYGTGSFLT